MAGVRGQLATHTARLGAIRLKAVQMHRGFSVDGGWELDLVLLTAALALVFLGAGAISLDRLLFGL